MKIVFLPSSVSDLAWMRRYYQKVFPQGSVAARDQYVRTKNLLKNAPYIGEKITGIEGVREFPVSRTPFSIIYRTHDDQIEIMRVVDNRSNWALNESQDS